MLYPQSCYGSPTPISVHVLLSQGCYANYSWDDGVSQWGYKERTTAERGGVRSSFLAPPLCAAVPVQTEDRRKKERWKCGPFERGCRPPFTVESPCCEPMTLKRLEKANEWVSGQTVTEPRLRSARSVTKGLTSVILRSRRWEERRDEEREEEAQGQKDVLGWCLAFRTCIGGRERRRVFLSSKPSAQESFSV